MFCDVDGPDETSLDRSTKRSFGGSGQLGKGLHRILLFLVTAFWFLAVLHKATFQGHGLGRVGKVQAQGGIELHVFAPRSFVSKERLTRQA